MIDIPVYKISFIELNELFYGGQLDESQSIELKSRLSTDQHDRPDGREFAKDVTGFVNASGGLLIIGIDEERKEICGVDEIIGQQKISDWMANVLVDNVDKTVSYELVKIPISEEGLKCVFIIDIKEGKDKPYYVLSDKKPIPYIRKGTSVFAAKPSDIKEMYLSKSDKNAAPQRFVTQNATGRNISQIGINNSTIISTERVTKKNEVIANPDIHITEKQAKEIKEMIDKIADINERAGKFSSKDDKARFYRSTWKSLYNKFDLTSYKLIEKKDFENVIQWLNREIAFKHRPKLRRTDNTEWRNQHYTAIYSRARVELGMDKQALYRFAEEKLGLKKALNSLKDLNDSKLKRLYQLLFSK